MTSLQRISCAFLLAVAMLVGYGISPKIASSAGSFPIDYTPSGGPIAAAAAPGYSQLVAAGLEDSNGNAVSVNSSNQLVFVDPTAFSSELSDAAMTGSNTDQSSTVVYFTASNPDVSACIFARATGTLPTGGADDSGSTFIQVCLSGAGSSGTTLSIVHNNNGTAAAVTNCANCGVAFSTTLNATYALKFDLSTGTAPLTITAKVFALTPSIAQVGLSAIDTESNFSTWPSGYNSFAEYNATLNSTPLPVSRIQIYNVLQADSIVGGAQATPGPTATPTATSGPSTVPSPATPTPSPNPTLTPMAQVSPAAVASARGWLVTSGGTVAPVSASAFSTAAPDTTVSVSATQHQTWDGFGGAYIDFTSAWFAEIPPANLDSVMRAMFSPGAVGAGLNALRLAIGSPDIVQGGGGPPTNINDQLGTEDDQPTGTVDPDLFDFNFTVDDSAPSVVDFCREARAYNPNLKVYAAPWAPPAWMSTIGSRAAGTGLGNGTLIPDYYQAYANYIVKWVQGYQARGCPIYALSPQNEPQFASTYGTMLLSETQEASFIGTYLGPAIQAAGLSTLIMGYDHNWDSPSYSQTLLGSAAASFLAGNAYHTYDPSESDQTTEFTAVSNNFPTKSIWMTEADNLSPSVADTMPLLINGINLNARSFLYWSLFNGPAEANAEPTTITTAGAVTVNPGWAVAAGFNAAVDMSSKRLGTTVTGSVVQATAFVNGDGTHGAIIWNSDTVSHAVKVVDANGLSATVTIPAGGFQSVRYGKATTAGTPLLPPRIGSPQIGGS